MIGDHIGIYPNQEYECSTDGNFVKVFDEKGNVLGWVDAKEEKRRKWAETEKWLNMELHEASGVYFKKSVRIG
jgi:hypothetical protein